MIILNILLLRRTHWRRQPRFNPSGSSRTCRGWSCPRSSLEGKSCDDRTEWWQKKCRNYHEHHQHSLALPNLTGFFSGEWWWFKMIHTVIWFISLKWCRGSRKVVKSGFTSQLAQKTAATNCLTSSMVKTRSLLMSMSNNISYPFYPYFYIWPSHSYQRLQGRGWSLKTRGLRMPCTASTTLCRSFPRKECDARAPVDLSLDGSEKDNSRTVSFWSFCFFWLPIFVPAFLSISFLFLLISSCFLMPISSHLLHPFASFRILLLSLLLFVIRLLRLIVLVLLFLLLWSLKEWLT